VIAGTCTKEDCTVATTGTCVLSHPAPADCPHYKPTSAAAPTGVDTLPAAMQEAPVALQAARKFHSGDELGTIDAIEIMQARYAHLVGILGSTDAGKTCFLSSLYLMASGGKLPNAYQFAGSLTLQAFEDRARGLRRWPQGGLPTQLVDHTVLKDKRQPSLLHLAMRERNDVRRRFDLLLTDLPGEWTDRLALRASNAESFRFLCRADGIVIVVDGKLLRSDQRHVEVQRMRYCVERLANDVKVDLNTPFVILVSKSDEIGMEMPPAAQELEQHVQGLGFPATTILSAAFSRKPAEVANGTGVFSAIEAILAYSAPELGPQTLPGGKYPQSRTFQEFRE
jgi:Double-GTPase 2